MTRPLTEEQRLRISTLYRGGMTCRSIAAEMGLAHSTIHRHVATNGSSIALAGLSNRGKKGKGKAVPTAAPTQTRETKYSYHPFVPPTDGPICNATMTDRYSAKDLIYRR